MIQKLDEFVKENIVELQVPIIKKNEFSNDSLMFIFKEPGHNSSAIFDRFVKELAANNIDFKIEYEHSQVVDQGASGGLYEVIIFIANTLASGILYDIIKNVPGLECTELKKERFDILKEKAASSLSTQPENIEITHFKLDNQDIELEVFFNRSKYSFIFNKKNKIVAFKKF